MGGFLRFGGLVLCLAGMGCDAGGNAPADAPGNDAAAVQNEAANVAEADPALPPCPFRETKEWAGSVEGGRLLVTGRVDLQMAGFKPTLTPRASAPSTIALYLALAPKTGAAVTDEVTYQAAGAPAYRRGEIWCGGEMIESFDVVVVG